jgi:hypothetical protein
MSLLDKIPLSGGFVEGLGQGNDLMQRFLMGPVERRHKEAVAKNQEAEAQKSQMLANLIQRVMGGSTQQNMQNVQPMELGQQGENTNNIGMTQEQLFKGLFGIPQETPQEQRKRDTEQALNTEEGKKNIGIENELKKQQRDLRKLKNTADQIQEIFNSGENITGMWEAGKNKLNLSSNKKLASLIEKFGRIQAEIARYASTRGGAQALEFARSMKPNEWKPQEFNQGMLDSIYDFIGQQDQDLLSEYSDIKTNKPMSALEKKFKNTVPKSDNERTSVNPEQSDIENGLITVITPDGEEHKIFRDKLEEAKRKHPGLKVKKETFNAAKI